MRTPAALVAIPLLAGAAAGLLVPDLPAYQLPVCAAGAALLCLLAAWGGLGHGDDGMVVTGILAGCVCAGVSLGVSASREAYTPSLLTWFDARPAGEQGDPVAIEGMLREDAREGPAGISLTIDVTRAGEASVRGGVRLSVGGSPPPGTAAAWRAGRTIRLPALLRRPATYVNPGVPDEAAALARRGVVLVGSVKSAALVEMVRRGSAVDETASAARDWARRTLARDVGRWHAQSGAIAAAILIGDRSGLSDEDQRRLQEAGTYHVIAISGGNIAILVALLLLAMRLLGINGRAAAGAAILVLIFYGRLAEGGASVSRAVTAACVFLGGRVLDHRGPALNALAVAATVAIAMSPVVVFDAGFILSFGASLGILLGAGPLVRPFWSPPRPGRADTARGDAGASPVAASGGRRVPESGGGLATRWHRGPVASGMAGLRRALHAAAGAVLAMTAATFSAEAAILPVSAAVFSRVTFAGLVLNFAAIPLMTVVQAGAIATLVVEASAALAPLHLLSWAPPGTAAGVAGVCGYVTHAAAGWLVRSASLVKYAPWMSRDVAPPSWSLVAVYYAAAVTLLAWPAGRAAAGGAMTAGVALILWAPAPLTRDAVPPAPRGWLRVVFLDVGQGDATLLQLPRGRALLVDAGGQAGSSFDIGDRVVAPALRAFGVRALDTLVVTHGDPDHLGGMPSILRRFPPRAIWEGVPVPPHAKLRELAGAAAAAGVSWRIVQAGDWERDDGVELRVLHPPPPDWERQRVRNEDSIVLEVRYGDVSIVLPGDIGAEGERAVLRQLTPARTVVVKAPHHGSASSSTPAFVRAAHPAAVVFSAGRGNRFGHPAPAVVERYRAAGAALYLTARDGAIVLDTDGHTLTLGGHSSLR